MGCVLVCSKCFLFDLKKGSSSGKGSLFSCDSGGRGSLFS